MKMSNYYMNGNTARQTRTAPGPERRQVRVVEPTGRKQGKNQKMSLGYVLFMSVALAFMGVMLVFYIGLQSEVKSTVKTISQKESELNNLRNSNDEMESRVKSDVDLEEIKEIAMGQLGMIYAKEGQIEIFLSEDSDYVRQLQEIPAN